MKTPKTVKGYLKLLIKISEDSAHDLKGTTEEDIYFLGDIRASIQNLLGEDEHETMKRNGLKWNG